MPVLINTHAMLTKAATSSTTGTLTASAGDLAVVAINVSTAIALGSVSGGGLTWTNQIDNTASLSHLWIFTAPVPSDITAQTITVTATGSSFVGGSLISFRNALGIGNIGNGSGTGSGSQSKTITTKGNGSMVLALAGTSDAVYTAPASQLDTDGVTYVSGQASGTSSLNTSVTIAATSAGSGFGTFAIYEVTPITAIKFNNSGLRPHLFSPGLAR